MRYTKKTEKKPSRDDILWKTYRNVEASERFPDLWSQFRTDLYNAENGVMPMVVGSKDPNLGSNALNRPDRTPPLKIPDHTGHKPEQVDTGSKGYSGSHGKWSAHAKDVLDQAKTRLEKQYGSLDKVPDDVMEKTKQDVMQQLREDLLDKDLGLEEGWVKPTKNGMDKLSQVQSTDQIG